MTNFERQLVLRILSHEAGLNEVVLQGKVNQVAPEDLASYHIQFVYEDAPVPEGGYVVLQDWRARDKDGAPLELLALGGGDGRVYEIEITRLDQLPILKLPTSSDWE